METVIHHMEPDICGCHGNQLLGAFLLLCTKETFWYDLWGGGPSTHLSTPFLPPIPGNAMQLMVHCRACPWDSEPWLPYRPCLPWGSAAHRVTHPQRVDMPTAGPWHDACKTALPVEMPALMSAQWRGLALVQVWKPRLAAVTRGSQAA